MILRSLSLLACLCCATSSAAAYSDPAWFAESADVGGGAGRQFTGSPADGHACSVCHRGGDAPDVELTGLPDVFEPGRLYEVTLHWDGSAASHALQLELIDAAGKHPGVSIEPASVVGADGRCDSAEDGDPANYALDLGGRRIVGVRDCGASRVAIQFKAPDQPELYFAASIVRTDSSGTAHGDGALDIRRTLKRQGETASTGCRVGANATGELGGFALLLAILLQRYASSRSKVASSASTRDRPTNAK